MGYRISFVWMRMGSTEFLMGVQVGRLGHLRFCLGCVFYRNPRWIPAFFSFFSLHKSDIAPSSPCRIFDFSYSFYSFPFFDLVTSLSFFEVTTYDLVHVGFSVYHNTYIHTYISTSLPLSSISLLSTSFLSTLQKNWTSFSFCEECFVYT